MHRKLQQESTVVLLRLLGREGNETLKPEAVFSVGLLQPARLFLAQQEMESVGRTRPSAQAVTGWGRP